MNQISHVNNKFNSLLDEETKSKDSKQVYCNLIEVAFTQRFNLQIGVCGGPLGERERGGHFQLLLVALLNYLLLFE